MAKKIFNISMKIIFPIVVMFAIGVFMISTIASGMAFAVGGDGGGFYVRSSSKLEIGSGTIISGNTATNGGGVYVSESVLNNSDTYTAETGELILNGGTIAGNTAISGNGHDVYNNGTFTMTGGTVGTSGSPQSGFGIYNTGTMNLYGGTVYDNIYSSKSFNMSVNANINGTITLENSAIITVYDYSETTPTLKINVKNDRQDGTILKLKGSSTIPDLNKISITGFNSDTYSVVVLKGDSDDEWLINILEQVQFPKTWKTEIASTTYMSTTLTPANLTSIIFSNTVPTGYSLIGTLSTGVNVYQSSTVKTKIAFVNSGPIYAPVNSSGLFGDHYYDENGDEKSCSALTSLTSIDCSNLNTSNVTNMMYMFSGCSSLKNINVSSFDTSKVTSMHDIFDDCTSLVELDCSSFNLENHNGNSLYMFGYDGTNKLNLKLFKIPYNNPTINYYNNYDFYNTSAEGKGYETQIPANFVSSVTLAAKFTITFNAVTGTVYGESILSSEMYYGDYIYKSAPRPALDGYTFDGWYTTTTGGIKLNNTKKVTTNATYYAHYVFNSEIEDDTIKFGSYLGRDIGWDIIATEDGKSLLLSRYIIEYLPFGEYGWASSSLQQWLNGDFYKDCFTTDEKQKICETEIDGTGYKVFLLSVDEYNSYCDVGDEYLKIKSSTGNTTNSSVYKTVWWTRDAYERFTRWVYVINEVGDVDYSFFGADACGVVPAIWVDNSVVSMISENQIIEREEISNILETGETISTFSTNAIVEIKNVNQELFLFGNTQNVSTFASKKKTENSNNSEIKIIDQDLFYQDNKKYVERAILSISRNSKKAYEAKQFEI